MYVFLNYGASFDLLEMSIIDNLKPENVADYKCAVQQLSELQDPFFQLIARLMQN